MVFKKLLTILFIGCSLIAKSQDYVANWVTVPKEVAVVNYQVQKSANNTTWTTIATIAPKKSIDSNYYAYILPTANNYIRIKALMINNIAYTVPIKVVNTNVLISNQIVKGNGNFDNVSFTAANELAVDYYSIEKSNTDNNWTIAGKLKQTNKNNYMVNIYGNNKRYRIRSVYKNGIRSDYIYF